MGSCYNTLMGELRAQRRIEPQPDLTPDDDFSLDAEAANEPGPAAATESATEARIEVTDLGVSLSDQDGRDATELIELVSDQDTEKIAKVTEAFNALSNQLNVERRRIITTLEIDLKWYERFSKMYRQHKEWLGHVEEAQSKSAAVHEKLLSSSGESIDAAVAQAENELKAIRAQVHEQVGLGDPIEEPSMPDLMFGWGELKKYTEVVENGPPVFDIESMGVSKERGQSDLKKLEGHLGEHGQDGSIVHNSDGVGVLFDGSGSMGKESYEYSLVIAKKIQEILSGIPANETNEKFIQHYVNDRFSEIGTLLRQMPPNTAGGGVFGAVRMLESGKLICVKVGDPHIVIKKGENDAQSVISNDLKLGVNPDGQAVIALGGNRDKIYMTTPIVEVVDFDPEEPLEVLLVSDGLDHNVLNPGGNEETPASVLDKGGVRYLRQDGVIQKSKDDMLAVHLRRAGQRAAQLAA